VNERSGPPGADRLEELEPGGYRYGGSGAGEQPTTDARILVVDDEEQNLTLLQAMLRAAGYRNVTALQRSAEAIERFVELDPDLILLDLHMPAPDGFAVMEAVRHWIDPGDFLPILVLSAEVSQAARERALSGGASDFVAKPLQLAEVLLRIRNLLERRRAHRQLRASHASAAAELAERHSLEQVEVRRLSQISDRVRTVLSVGGPTMVYQPIVLIVPPGGAPRLVVDLRERRDESATPELSAMAPVGVEALARFELPPVQGPDRWFEDAAQVDLALELELSAISGALGAVDQLPENMFLSVNASWTTIVSDEFHEILGYVDGSRLVVELTEHERVADYALLAGAVERLHARGTRLAIDDAGAGFASLDHILRLGPDIVKLDRNLVTGVDQDPIRRSMIAAFVHFADETGISLIAEGIESPGELETLRRLGVAHAQGYHLALPADLPTVLAATAERP
jgi:EAL domain-containing protein (putative c-di-GMP-specific phosphodiesterase class I)/DNA-binding response OmpR family regulator